MTREEYAIEYEKNFSRTQSFLRRRGVYPAEEAQDIAQSAWVRGLERLEQLNGNAANWVLSIAINIYRSKQRQNHSVTRSVPAYQPNIDSKILVDSVISKLDQRNARLLRMVLLGMDNREIASYLHCTPLGAKVRTTRARKAFRLVCPQEKKFHESLPQRSHNRSQELSAV